MKEKTRQRILRMPTNRHFVIGEDNRKFILSLMGKATPSFIMGDRIEYTLREKAFNLEIGYAYGALDSVKIYK